MDSRGWRGLWEKLQKTGTNHQLLIGHKHPQDVFKIKIQYSRFSEIKFGTRGRVVRVGLVLCCHSQCKLALIPNIESLLTQRVWVIDLAIDAFLEVFAGESGQVGFPNGLNACFCSDIKYFKDIKIRYNAR